MNTGIIRAIVLHHLFSCVEPGTVMTNFKCLRSCKDHTKTVPVSIHMSETATGAFVIFPVSIKLDAKTGKIDF